MQPENEPNNYFTPFFDPSTRLRWAKRSGHCLTAKSIDNSLHPRREYKGENHKDRTSHDTPGDAPQAWAEAAG
jgi:hypothetical protein